MALIVGFLIVSVAINVVLLLRPRPAPMSVIKATDFDPERCEPIAVAIRSCDGGFFLANPETGKKIEFTGCTAWSGHMAPPLGKAAIHFANLPVWPGHQGPPENVGEILLEHVPLMN